MVLGSESDVQQPTDQAGGARRLRSAPAASLGRRLQGAVSVGTSPSAKDWTALNGVTDVKDKGGVSWAGATARELSAAPRLAVPVHRHAYI